MARALQGISRRQIGAVQNAAPAVWQARMPQKWLNGVIAVVAASYISGCAVGPDFSPPPAPEVAGYTPQPLPRQTAGARDPVGSPQRFAIGRDIPGEWWRL